ncbi:glycosyltransferase family 2 protein [Streptomyces sp. GDS52]|uniref:glycosyltransferase family 2 protein n=1 Tax=Streptomyces sp. GDS52 TaxID=3406419 RepID=UPI003FD3B846
MSRSKGGNAAVAQPEVTVVIGAYEAMPYLVECLASLEAQTIAPERIEVIAVDDGSTDGTGECLEEFAGRAPMPVTVIRQANSGGPSGPRNIGLDRATGRYRTLAQCSALQGGGVGHPARSGPKGRGGMAKIALSDDGVVGPTAGRAGSQACGGRVRPTLAGRQWPVKQEPEVVPRSGTDRNLLPSGRRGRQVFFLDADDRLGHEALQRMVAMADRAGTDVVLGRVEGVNRGAPKSMWGRTLERTDVHSSPIKYTLSAQKLFRRALLVRHGIRFDESLFTGEDALFTMEAYLRANGVSVIADHTCYYLVGRDDGRHVTKSGSHTLRFESARRLADLIAALVPAGPRRDRLMLRPFTVTLLPQFGPRFLKDSDRVRRHKLELAKPLMDAHWSEDVARHLKVEERLRLHLVAEQRLELLTEAVKFTAERKQAPALLERRGRRVYLVYPHFRDRAAGVPDSVYLASPREARAFPGYREGGTATVLRRAARRARHLLTSPGRPAPEPKTPAAA